MEWHKSVGFKSHIPKHAFNMWLVSHDRLPTWDRLISWGLSVSPQCVLCESADESRSNLFFTCWYSIQIWQSLLDQSTFTPPTDLESIRLWGFSGLKDRNCTSSYIPSSHILHLAEKKQADASRHSLTRSNSKERDHSFDESKASFTWQEIERFPAYETKYQPNAFKLH